MRPTPRDMRSLTTCLTPTGTIPGVAHRAQAGEQPQPGPWRFSNLSKFLSQHDTGETGDTDTPDNDNHGEADSDGEGKLVSTETSTTTDDMREFLLPEDRAYGRACGAGIAAAIRYRRSRRRKAARKGALIDLRRVIRRSVSSGGEPMQLFAGVVRPSGASCRDPRCVGVHDALCACLPGLFAG